MPVDARTAAARRARHEARRAKAASVVPHGPYCYGHTGRMVEVRHVRDDGVVEAAPREVPEIARCPYWKARGDWRSQGYGYCRLTRMGDGVKHRPKRDGLLWDQCKSCGINDRAPDAPDDGPPD